MNCAAGCQHSQYPYSSLFHKVNPVKVIFLLIINARTPKKTVKIGIIQWHLLQFTLDKEIDS